MKFNYPKYYIATYYDSDYRGLEDSKETNDIEEAKDTVWEYLNHGGFVLILNHNNKSGKVKRMDLYPDELLNIDDGGEYLDDIFRRLEK